LDIRAIKIAAVSATTVGLLFLWFLASRTQVPTVSIGQVGATMNLAYVRLEGRVIRGPTYVPDPLSLAFWLADDTGQIYVAAYRHEAEELVAAGRIPTLGDGVSLTGTLRVEQDFTSLTISAADQVIVTRAKPSDRSVAEIDPHSELERVRLRGQVRDIRVPYQGLTLIGLRDATGAIDIAVPQETQTLTGDLPTLAPGQTIEVEGTVTLYRGTPQLTLTDAANIATLDERAEVAPHRIVSQIGPGSVGDWIGVQGFVNKVTPFSAGVKLTLDDGSGQITLLLWQDLYDELTGTTPLEEGTAVSVCGQVAEYHGQLELIPELPVDVQVTGLPHPKDPHRASTPTDLTPTAMPTSTPEAKETSVVSPSATLPPDRDEGTRKSTIASPTPTPSGTPTSTPSDTPTPTPSGTPTPTPSDTPTPTAAITATPMGDVSTERIGETLTVCGQVVRTASFSTGFKFTLDDGTGQIVLLLWQDVYDDVADIAGLNVGATVLVVGKVGQYNGELQITPLEASDVKITAASGRPVAPRREIGSLSPTDVGTLVEIEGDVNHVEGFSSGLRVFVTDGTGQVQLLLWQNVADRVPGREQLLVGARVKAVGQVEEYKGTLQVVPHLPVDVQVLP
jgi:DNA/RNA endonuclease YhcR with UshA esterase domain